MKRRTFRLEQDLIDAVDTVSIQFGLNRTQYLRRALRSAVYGDISLLNAPKLAAPTIRSLVKNLASESHRRKKRSKAGRGRLRLRDQLKGVRAAVRSDRTPPQFKAGLRKRAAQLEKALKDTPNA